jgi:hypothetical protein
VPLVPKNAQVEIDRKAGIRKRAHYFYERETMVNPTKKATKSLSFPEKSANSEPTKKQCCFVS